MEEISRPMKIMISSLAGDHHALADDGEQQQRVIFAGLRVLRARRKRYDDEHGQDADADHQHAEEGGEAIDDQHVRRTPGRAIA